MTISSTTVKNSYAGNGTLDTFNYTFKIFADSDLEVIIRDATATETVKTLTTHYTVTGAGSASGGTIVFTAGNIPSATETVVIRRAVPQTQAIDYIANDPFPAESHEEGLDRAMMTLQQLQEEVDRSIKLSRTNTMTSTEFTVGDTDRANKVFGFDASGELTVAQELGTFKGNWSSGTTFAVRDIIKDTSNNNVYICLTAHTSSGSQPISTNADVAKWGLLVDAASATTSATNAANSASAAATSETNAATSATTATTQATNSANSATASANSATSSAASAAAAEATFDLFDDTYLGAKASNPTLDNDGNALQDGALYFDTTNNVMKVYDLGTTTWFQLTPTVSNQTNINTVAAISSDVTQAASDSTDIQTVASDSADIRTLADIEDGTTATNAVSNAGNNATSIVTVAGQISPTNNISSVAAIAADITSVANIDTEVVAVSADATDIGTVASNIGNVTAVGNDLSNNFSYIEDNGSIADAVTSTAGTSLVETVANDIANVNLVGGSIANVNTVSSNLTGTNTIGTVATDIANVNLVGGSITNVNTVAADGADIGTVAGISANVTTVAGIASDVTTVATNNTNVTTVATNISGVNSFADRYRVVSADPTTSLDEGDLAYNTTANVLKYYDGSTWNPVVAGALTDVVQDGTPQLGGDLDGQNYNLNNIGTIDGTNLQIDFGGL